jgi:hypothetical protein
MPVQRSRTLLLPSPSGCAWIAKLNSDNGEAKALMTNFKIAILTAFLASTITATAFAKSDHRLKYRGYENRISIDYTHNYGPGVLPGEISYYDGPLRARCGQLASAYSGQDGRRHPCK